MFRTLGKKIRAFAHRDINRLQKKLLKELEEQKQQIREAAQQEKTELETLRTCLEEIREENQARLEQLREDYRTRLEQVRTENKTQLDQLREENKAQLEQVRKENQIHAEQLREENKACQEQAGEENRTRLEQLREETAAGLDRVRKENADLLEEIREENKVHVRRIRKAGTVQAEQTREENRALLEEIREENRSRLEQIGKEQKERLDRVRDESREQWERISTDHSEQWEQARRGRKKLNLQMESIEKTLSLERESVALMQGNIAELSDLIVTPQDLHSHHTYGKVKFGDISIERLLRDYTFQTVLDIGCGEGKHSDLFLEAGKDVTAIDYGESPYFLKNKSRIKAIVADFNRYEFDRQFDCVWCCHVLEHQLNPHDFLKKVHSVLKEDGVLCVTVPPAKQRISGGHVSLWNAGLLLYHLVLAGFDCSQAETLRYDYNVSVIVRKHTVDVMDKLVFDAGDITTIRPYLPENLLYFKGNQDVCFVGDTLNVDVSAGDLFLSGA